MWLFHRSRVDRQTGFQCPPTADPGSQGGSPGQRWDPEPPGRSRGRRPLTETSHMVTHTVNICAGLMYFKQPGLLSPSSGDEKAMQQASFRSFLNCLPSALTLKRKHYVTQSSLNCASINTHTYKSHCSMLIWSNYRPKIKLKKPPKEFSRWCVYRFRQT